MREEKRGFCIIFWRCVGRSFRRLKRVGEVGEEKNELIIIYCDFLEEVKRGGE